jgi:hypothetical protein
MADHRKPIEKRNRGLFERLFDEPWDLSDEEIDLVLGPKSPSADALDEIYRIASRVATNYRERGLPIPEHLDSALIASRPFARLDDAEPAYLLKIVEKLRRPFLGSVTDVAHAYRTISGLTEQDQQILDALSAELEKDWQKKRP